MSIDDLAQVRCIARFGVATPVLVPSFSSRGFPNIRLVMDALRLDISTACLLSAFDLKYGNIDVPFNELADLVLLDSGVYETAPATVSVDFYYPLPAAAPWTRNHYRSYLREANTRASKTNTIVVSFDTYDALEKQVDAALEDFSCIPDAAFDFLLKPTGSGEFLEPFRGTDIRLGNFDVLGVTERELGRSAVERCKSICNIRRALNDAGFFLPIHVFGAITPAAVTSYFL